MTVARDGKVGNMSPLKWRNSAAVSTVVAAAGYPDTPRAGDAIELPSFGDDVRVYHAGTARDAQGVLRTSGGRVFATTAIASTFAEAQQRSRDAASRIAFDGAQYRRDIGWREAARHAGTS